MDNLNKLLKYLLPNEEINKIVNEADVSREVVEKVCVDIFDKLIPSDFNRQDSGHIDKKDLNGISNNFNNLLTNDNLKALINEISEKYGVENVSQIQDVKLKKEQTCLKHFGAKCSFMSDECREKTKRTLLICLYDVCELYLSL